VEEAGSVRHVQECEQASVVLNVQHVQAQKAGGMMAQCSNDRSVEKVQLL